MTKRIIQKRTWNSTNVPSIALSNSTILNKQKIANAQSLTTSDFATYRNPVYGFTIRHPSEWTKLDISSSNAIFETRASNGVAMVDVILANNPAAQNTSPDELGKR